MLEQRPARLAQRKGIGYDTVIYTYHIYLTRHIRRQHIHELPVLDQAPFTGRRRY